jgi:hypothetical protein
MKHIFSLHKINNRESFGFNPSDYSRFKFGDDIVAQKFGIDLANQFINKYLRFNPIANQLVVISSPFSFIPTATYALKNYFVFELNRWLADNNFNVVQETKVHRTITYKEDYGELNAEQRMKLIGNDSFHIDKEFLKEKTLLFLDDIKITGSHERMINKMLLEYDLKNETHLLYFAELINNNIHPNIENQLNYFAVKSIFDLDDIVNSTAFRINTRIVKYILNYDFSAFRVFIDSQTESFISLLYNMALGNNYHTIEEYKSNLNYVKSNFIITNHKQIEHGN